MGRALGYDRETLALSEALAPPWSNGSRPSPPPSRARERAQWKEASPPALDKMEGPAPSRDIVGYASRKGSAELHAKGFGPWRKGNTFVGLDVHKETIAVAVAEGDAGAAGRACP